MNEFNQSTLFDAIDSEKKGNSEVGTTRPEMWKEMLFDVGEISVSVNENDRLKTANQPINFIEGFSVVSDYKALVNKISGAVISIVRKTYHAVSNIDVLNHFESLLNEQNIRFEYGFSKSARNGRKSVFEIILPDLKIDLGNGDTQEMRLYVQNSFDGGNAIRLQMGFFRHLCSNMALMHGKAEVNYKTSHIGDATDRIKTTFNMYITEKFNEATDFVKKLSRHSFSSSGAVLGFIHDEKNEVVSDRHRKKVEDMWNAHYSNDNSYWGVYNAYTAVITHEMTGSEIGKMDKLVKLSKIFDDLIESTPRP